MSPAVPRNRDLAERPLPKTLKATLDELAALPDECAMEVAAIERDPSLWPEIRAERIANADRQTKRRRDQLGAHARALGEERKTRHSCLRTSRRLDVVARERVRSMLQQGGSPVDILEQAGADGDAELIAALRAEVRDSTVARRPGETRRDPAAERQSESVLLACDRVLADLDGDETLRRSLTEVEAAEAIEPVARFALVGTEGKPLNVVAGERIIMAHALGETKGEGPQLEKEQGGVYVEPSAPETSQPGEVVTSR